jgi:hypothetical protein
VQKALFGEPAKKHQGGQLEKLKRVADLLGAVPDRTGFIYDQAQTLDIAIEVTKLMHRLRPFQELAEEYGSWFKLLVASGVLPKGTRRTQYGTMVTARDGHECLSLAEKTIDDLLFEHGIAHEREPSYPGAAYSADWKIRVGDTDVYIELFGLDGHPGYTKRMREKLAYAQETGMTVVALQRRDLANLRAAFEKKVLELLPCDEPLPRR